MSQPTTAPAIGRRSAVWLWPDGGPNPVPKGRLKIRAVQIRFSEEVCGRCFWVEAPCFSRGRQRFSVAGINLTSILRFSAGLCIIARLTLLIEAGCGLFLLRDLSSNVGK